MATKALSRFYLPNSLFLRKYVLMAGAYEFDWVQKHPDYIRVVCKNHWRRDEGSRHNPPFVIDRITLSSFCSSLFKASPDLRSGSL